MPTTIHVKTEVRLPQLPNFLRTIRDETSIDVADITDEGLRELGARWTEALLEHAATRRRIRTGRA